MGLIDSEEEEGVLSTAARAGIVEVCFLLAQPEVEGGRRTPRHPATATVRPAAALVARARDWLPVSRLVGSLRFCHRSWERANKHA